MAFTLNFGRVTKRRNSTLVPDLNDELSVVLKDGCSETAPVFIINADGFYYNYCQWGSWYYWITDVEYTRNNLYTVSCRLDPLATFRDYILASTQYVAYSSVSGGAWLRDNRLPVLGSATVTKSEVAAPFINTGGNKYILTVLGLNGCASFACTRSEINDLLNHVQGDNTQLLNDFMTDPAIDFTTVETGLESLTRILTQTDLLGNAFSNAPACIRGCIWTPLALPTGGTANIFLGQYDTQVSGWKLFDTTAKSAVQVSIPWQFTDWRRAYCEAIYLYLPYVGNINIPTGEIVGETTLTIKYSYTIVDGSISYEVLAGNQVIGTYGAAVAQQIPLGINQVTSAGDIATTVLQGASDTLSTGIIPSAAMAVEGVRAAYNVADAVYTRNPTTIGGMGGGSSAGLDTNIICVSVAHPTVIDPAAMAGTMGVPTMQPLTLSSCSGFCQCVNAHVAAPVEASALDEIDMFLNTGFYIE